MEGGGRHSAGRASRAWSARRSCALSFFSYASEERAAMAIVPVDGAPVPMGLVTSETDMEARREAATEWSLRWVALQRAADPTRRLAAIFDIDSTLVHGCGRREEMVPIRSIQRAFHALRKCNVTPFVVTARSSDGRAETEALLRDHGLHPRHLFMHPASSPLESARDAAREKRRARARIEDKGYTVVVSYGDAWSDHDLSSRGRLARLVPKDGVAVFLDDGTPCVHIKLPTIRAE